MRFRHCRRLHPVEHPLNNRFRNLTFATAILLHAIIETEIDPAPANIARQVRCVEDEILPDLQLEYRDVALSGSRSVPEHYRKRLCIFAAPRHLTDTGGLFLFWERTARAIPLLSLARPANNTSQSESWKEPRSCRQ